MRSMPLPISREELDAAIRDAQVTVVDALPPAPFGQRHLPGALNVVAEDTDEQVRAALPDLDAAIVTYSTDQHCTRGPQLADRLRRLGYRDVRNYDGGIEDWIAGGLQVERPRSVRLTLAELALGPSASLFEGDPRAGVDASIFVTRTPVGHAVELHTHPYAEVFLLLEGRGRWTSGEAVIELEPDQLLVVPADTPHGFRNIGQEPLLVVCLHERGVVRTTWLGDEPA
jgi:mannose-6-phosphate isomerase-like protein (cupin superfamily)